jgi:hypothetical protein
VGNGRCLEDPVSLIFIEHAARRLIEHMMMIRSFMIAASPEVSGTTNHDLI